MNKLPVAIILPHASLAVPPELDGRMRLSAAQIFNEADVYIDQIFDFQEQVLYWERFPYARALIDVNRPDDPLRTRPGDGIVKRQTSYGTAVYEPGAEPDEVMKRALIDRYWKPWTARLAEIADDPKVELVIDAHSMAALGPQKYDDPGAYRPRSSVSNLGNLTGDVNKDRWPFLSASPAITRLVAATLAPLVEPLPSLAPMSTAVTLNTPFGGGWDLMGQAANARQPWLMIELNRGLYVGAQHGDSLPVSADSDRVQALRQAMWSLLEDVTSQLSMGL